MKLNLTVVKSQETKTGSYYNQLTSSVTKDTAFGPQTRVTRFSMFTDEPLLEGDIHEDVDMDAFDQVEEEYLDTNGVKRSAIKLFAK